MDIEGSLNELMRQDPKKFYNVVQTAMSNFKKKYNEAILSKKEDPTIILDLLKKNQDLIHNNDTNEFSFHLIHKIINHYKRLKNMIKNENNNTSKGNNNYIPSNFSSVLFIDCIILYFLSSISVSFFFLSIISKSEVEFSLSNEKIHSILFSLCIISLIIKSNNIF